MSEGTEPASAFDKVYKDPRPRPLGDIAGCGKVAGLQGSDLDLQNQCEQASTYQDGRRIIGRLIDYHNRQSVQLHALLRAIPQDLSREAEQALYDLAKTALGSIR